MQYNQLLDSRLNEVEIKVDEAVQNIESLLKKFGKLEEKLNKKYQSLKVNQKQYISQAQVTFCEIKQTITSQEQELISKIQNILKTRKSVSSKEDKSNDATSVTSQTLKQSTYIIDQSMYLQENQLMKQQLQQQELAIKQFQYSLDQLKNGILLSEQTLQNQMQQYQSQQQDRFQKQVDEIKHSLQLQDQIFKQGQRNLTQTIDKQQDQLNLYQQQINQITGNNIQNNQKLQEHINQQKQNQANLLEQQNSFVNKVIFTNCQQCLIQEIQQIKYELNQHKGKIEQNIKKIDKTHAKIKSQEFSSKHNYQSHTPLNQKLSFVERMSIDGYQSSSPSIQEYTGQSINQAQMVESTYIQQESASQVTSPAPTLYQFQQLKKTVTEQAIQISKLDNNYSKIQSQLNKKYTAQYVSQILMNQIQHRFQPKSFQQIEENLYRTEELESGLTEFLFQIQNDDVEFQLGLSTETSQTFLYSIKFPQGDFITGTEVEEHFLPRKIRTNDVIALRVDLEQCLFILIINNQTMPPNRFEGGNGSLTLTLQSKISPETLFQQQEIDQF